MKNNPDKPRRMDAAKELPVGLPTRTPRQGHVDDQDREARVIRGQQMNNDHLMGLIRHMRDVINHNAQVLDDLIEALGGD